MKGKRNTGAVDELMSKGFSKAKCAQALKDAGNNTTIALRMLEQQRQRQAGSTQQGPSPVATANADDSGVASTTSRATAASIPSLHRAPPRTAEATAAQAALQRQRARRHPCVVQYGSCQYGDHCVLRDFPGDVCVQYSQGCCVFGSSCRHRHVVDGWDVRDVVRGARASYDDDDATEWATSESAAAAPDAATATPQPTHAEPQWCVYGGDSDEETSPPVHHPTPFRDAASAPPRDAAAAVVVARAPPAATANSRPAARHPCVAQYGSCKYGDRCLYADRDADVCVHFLAGHCRFSEGECRYRHESTEDYQKSLRIRAGLAHTAPDATATAPAPTAGPRRAKARLQSGPTSHPPASSVAASPTSRSHLPSMEDLSKVGETNLPPDESETAAATAAAAAAAAGTSDAETRVFLGLVEAYPLVEPSVVLQALRLCGGDPIAVSDMLQQFAAPSSSLSTTDVDSLAAALAVAAAEEAAEKEALEEAANHTKTNERHNALLTLLMLFPSTEVSAVEAVLSQKRYDFGAAYGVLLCAQERMAQKALWQGSTATLTPTDTLRLEKLCNMFAGLHPDIVRSAFCATERDWTATTTALNELTKELLELEAVEVPAGPVVWRPPTHPAQQQQRTAAVTAPAAALMAVEGTEAAHAAFRAAEKEILSYGDWRQVRQQAYLVNSQRIRVLGMATAAFHQGDGRTVKLLSREGQRMAVEYNRLNRLAMLALEHERLRSDAMSTLDLHGFHTAEVHDVVVRRVALCQRRRIGQLRIVVGEGLHSKRGHASIYTTLMEELRTDAFLRAAVKVRSIKAGYIDVSVVFSAAGV